MEALVNSGYLVLALSALCLAALVLAVIGLWRLRRLAKFQKVFFQGKTGSELEEVIIAHNEQLHRMITELRELGRKHKELAALQELAIQRVGLVRFNSFGESGGSNSFSLALLDKAGSGALITSLHGRDSQRVYVKPVVDGASKILLTEEEKQAIMESQNTFTEAQELSRKKAGGSGLRSGRVPR